MQELPLVALPPQQPQHFQAVGYPLLSLSQGKGKHDGDGFGGLSSYGPIVMGQLQLALSGLDSVANS